MRCDFYLFLMPFDAVFFLSSMRNINKGCRFTVAGSLRDGLFSLAFSF